MKTTILSTATAFLMFFSMTASDTLSIFDQLTPEQQMEFYYAYVDSVEATFTFEDGLINLKNDVAQIDLPSSFKYLNAEDSETVLTDLWGNPPSEEGAKSLGMLFEKGTSLRSENSFAINITYSEEGYIKDDDAKDLDYNDLLETMQQDVEEANEYRRDLGYESIELVGWASQPFYDAEDKKLHWAKELKFGDSDESTLNYNIRILGRKGYLELNAISSIDVLGKVKSNINPIIESVDFNDGYRYADFNPDLDEVAAYGIGGLIAGKVLLKAGILAKIGLVLAKFWKFIAIGIFAFGAGIKNFLGGKKKQTVHTHQPSESDEKDSVG